MFDKIIKKIKDSSTQTLILEGIAAVIGAGVLGFLIRSVIANIQAIIIGESYRLDPHLFLELPTWITGLITVAVLIAVFWWGTGAAAKMPKNLLNNDKSDVESVLENSRFMTDKERDANFTPQVYENLAKSKKDGVPVRAVLDKNGRLCVNFMSGAHALVIGSTGSGKTTTFINPMIQLLAATNCGSSMIMTDPKGELFDLHSKFLHDRGYEVLVLDLRDRKSVV